MRFKGFTLMEVIISSVGMLVVGFTLFIVYRSTLDTMALVSAKSSVTNKLQVAFEQIGRDVQSAQRRVETTCGGFVYNLPNAVTTLVLEGIPGAPRVIYNVSGGTLQRIAADANCVQTAPPRALATNVTGWGFCPCPWVAGNRYVETRLQVRSDADDGPFVITSGKLAVRHQMRN